MHLGTSSKERQDEREKAVLLREERELLPLLRERANHLIPTPSPLLLRCRLPLLLQIRLDPPDPCGVCPAERVGPHGTVRCRSSGRPESAAMERSGGRDGAEAGSSGVGSKSGGGKGGGGRGDRKSVV